MLLIKLCCCRIPAASVTNKNGNGDSALKMRFLNPTQTIVVLCVCIVSNLVSIRRPYLRIKFVTKKITRPKSSTTFCYNSLGHFGNHDKISFRFIIVSYRILILVIQLMTVTLFKKIKLLFLSMNFNCFFKDIDKT